MSKKAIKIFLTAILLLCLCSCKSSTSPTQRVPVSGITGSEAYTNFIDNLESGNLRKIHYSFHSLYEFCTSEATVIKFNTNDAGKRELLYRQRHPFVLWDYPPYDYYDGDTYYYKYKNNWYIDEFNKYENVQKQDFVAIKETFFTGNDVLFDVIYHDVNGYSAEATVQSHDKTIYYAFKAKLNRNFQFNSIKITKHSFNYETSKFEPLATSLYYYTHINKDIPVAIPKGLDISQVENSYNEITS